MPTKIPPRCAAPFAKGGFWVPSFDKGGREDFTGSVAVYEYHGTDLVPNPEYTAAGENGIGPGLTVAQQLVHGHGEIIAVTELMI